MNYKKIFTKIARELTQVKDIGKVANYIPELSTVEPSKFGIHLTTIKTSILILEMQMKSFLYKV